MFILGGARTFRVEFPGIGIALILREADPDELDQFHKDLAESINPPGKMAEDERKKLRDRLYDDLRHAWCGKLLMAWEGICDESGKDLPCNDTHKAAFLAEFESRKYTIPTAQAYFFPVGQVANTPSFRGA